MPLTEAQEKIVHKAKGHFLVRACPGSGKTYTLAYKLLNDISSWDEKRSGIAALSFTNAAQEELLKHIENIAQSGKIQYPHFVGTIDSFINKYIFFPYSYLVGFDAKNVDMIGEPFGKFYSHSVAEIKSLALKYDLEGNLSPLSNARDMNGQFLENAKNAKASLIRRGRFTQSDAIYYAMKILEANPEIAKSLARRFPYVYVDEAQDTTALHWEIIKAITNCDDVKQFGVVGDPDQSIYSWNGADPSLFTNYEAELAAKGCVYLLNESRRSSQVICDFYFPLSTLESAPKAINPDVAQLTEKPTVLYYEDYKGIMGHVDTFIEAHKDDDFLVLCRSRTMIKEIAASLSKNPIALDQIPWSDNRLEPQALVQSKYEFENGDYRIAVRRIERLIFTLNKRYKLDEYLSELNITSKEWYRRIEDLLSTLPSVQGKTIEEWVAATEPMIKKMPLIGGLDLKLKNKGKIDYRSTEVVDYFSSYDVEAEEEKIQTVHSAKGKTTDHTLLVLNRIHANKIINAILGQEDLTEDKRIIYVGITRSCKSLTLCAPLSVKAKLDKALK